MVEAHPKPGDSPTWDDHGPLDEGKSLQFFWSGMQELAKNWKVNLEVWKAWLVVAWPERHAAAVREGEKGM